MTTRQAGTDPLIPMRGDRTLETVATSVDDAVTARDRAIRAMYQTGTFTYEQIGAVFSITRERVRQIIVLGEPSADASADTDTHIDVAPNPDAMGGEGGGSRDASCPGFIRRRRSREWGRRRNGHRRYSDADGGGKSGAVRRATMNVDGRKTNGGQRRKEHCHAGHSLADAYQTAQGRRCRPCDLQRQKARRAAR